MEQAPQQTNERTTEQTHENTSVEEKNNLLSIWQFQLDSKGKRGTSALSVTASTIEAVNARLRRIAEKYKVESFSFKDVFDNLLDIAESKMKVEAPAPAPQNDIFKSILNSLTKTVGVEENDYPKLTTTILEQKQSLSEIAAVIDDPEIGSPKEIAAAIIEMINKAPKVVEVEKTLNETQLVLDLHPTQLKVLNAIQENRAKKGETALTKQEIINKLWFHIKMLTNDYGSLYTGLKYNESKHVLETIK